MNMTISLVIVNPALFPTDAYVSAFSNDVELVLILPSAKAMHITSSRLKILTVAEELSLGNKCLRAAEQLSSDYLVITDQCISSQYAQTIVAAMNARGMLFGKFEHNCICLHRTSLLCAGDIPKLAKMSQIAQKRFDDAQLDSVINLNTPIDKLFSDANRNKEFISSAIASHLADQQKGTFYQRLFLKSLDSYLHSGHSFESVDDISRFYKNVLLDGIDHVPWSVGILQSYWHLHHDAKEYQVPTCCRTDRVAVLVSVYNECKFTEVCLKAIRKYSGIYAYIVVINNSTDDLSIFKQSVAARQLADLWIESGVHAHADGLNAALKYVRDFKYICTLDSDAVALRRGWLEEMVHILNDNAAGIVGPQTFPNSRDIKALAVHPCCMVIDQAKLARCFQIDFACQWPWDVGHLLTWDCIAHNIPTVYVSHDIVKDYAIGSSLVNKSVRHFWYTSRILKLDDDQMIDGIRVGLIRAKLQEAFQSPEIKELADGI